MQYQWTLLEGVNDGDDEIEGIVRLLKGKYAVLNMIPYNTVDGLHFDGPAGSAPRHRAHAAPARRADQAARLGRPGRRRRLRAAARTSRRSIGLISEQEHKE